MDKEKYQLTLTTTGKAEEVYLGELKTGTLKLERTDPKTGDVTRLSIETLADDVRTGQFVTAVVLLLARRPDSTGESG